MPKLDNTADKFIGKGYVFPIELNSSGRPDLKNGKELLEASLKAILSWVIGTRFFLEEFGSKLELLLQEPNDLVTEVLVKDFTIGVISKWEKRLQVLEVNIIRKDDVSLFLSIHYQINTTKLKDTFVFPYYSQLIY